MKNLWGWERQVWQFPVWVRSWTTGEPHPCPRLYFGEVGHAERPFTCIDKAAIVQYACA